MRSQGRIHADLDVDVAFHDVDMVGVVWHGHYVRYLENARWALMDRLGYGLQRMIDSGYAWPIIELHTRHVGTAHYGERLRVRASLTEWENRIAINYLISRPADGVRVLRARTVQVAVEGGSGTLQFVSPPDFIAAVQAAMEMEAA